MNQSSNITYISLKEKASMRNTINTIGSLSVEVMYHTFLLFSIFEEIQAGRVHRTRLINPPK
jgi:hypothetical protein